MSDGFSITVDCRSEGLHVHSPSSVDPSTDARRCRCPCSVCVLARRGLDRFGNPVTQGTTAAGEGLTDEVRTAMLNILDANEKGRLDLSAASVKALCAALDDDPKPAEMQPLDEAFQEAAEDAALAAGYARLAEARANGEEPPGHWRPNARWRSRASELEAERDALRARLAAIQAVVGSWDENALDRIRAAMTEEPSDA